MPLFVLVDGTRLAAVTPCTSLLSVEVPAALGAHPPALGAARVGCPEGSFALGPFFPMASPHTHDGDKLFRDVWKEWERILASRSRPITTPVTQDELVTLICEAADPDHSALIRTASHRSTRNFIKECGLEMGVGNPSDPDLYRQSV